MGEGGGGWSAVGVRCLQRVDSEHEIRSIDLGCSRSRCCPSPSRKHRRHRMLRLPPPVHLPHQRTRIARDAEVAQGVSQATAAAAASQHTRGKARPVCKGRV